LRLNFIGIINGFSKKKFIFQFKKKKIKEVKDVAFTYNDANHGSMPSHLSIKEAVAWMSLL
jgi:hypothetical protein